LPRALARGLMLKLIHGFSQIVWAKAR
jgi:hypothetical protein